MVYLDKVEGTHGRANSSEPGRRISITATASGLASLAYLPRRFLMQLSKATTDWTGHVPFDGIHLADLRDKLAEVQRTGYATSISAMTKGVNAVAAPIWWQDDVPYGSLVLTADEKNMPSDELHIFGAKVRDMADEVTVSLGGVEARRRCEQASAESLITI